MPRPPERSPQRASRPAIEPPDPAVARQRWRLLGEIDRSAGPVLDLLGAVWLVLLIVEFVWDERVWITLASQGIWVLFIADAAIGLLIAPKRGVYLRRNWLTLLALAVPALRILRVARFGRVLRAARAARSVRLVRVLTSINRGMRTWRRTVARKGLVYVLGLTLIVTFIGAAGMFAFERPPDGLLGSYSEALWWTAMVMTTMGSEYWPRTLEGRILALLLAMYAFAVFGYVTAAIASLLVEGEIKRGADGRPSADR